MTAAIAPTDRPRLKREIGLWMATALVVGNMIGSGRERLAIELELRARPSH